jgi:hypothetical protein
VQTPEMGVFGGFFEVVAGVGQARNWIRFTIFYFFGPENLLLRFFFFFVGATLCSCLFQGRHSGIEIWVSTGAYPYDYASLD